MLLTKERPKLPAHVLVVSSYGFIMYVFKVNSFAAHTIRVEENQKVIDSGPYALVRHPMYTGALLLLKTTAGQRFVVLNW